MIQCLPQSEHLLLAGDAGVFLLPANANAWQDQSAGLPNVIVSDIEVNEALNTVYVSTFGRGIWATDLDLLTQVAPVSTAPSNSYVIYSQGPQQFTLQRTTLPESPVDVQIVNVEGKRILDFRMALLDHTFSTHQWAAGLYFVCIRDAQGLQVKKIVVHGR